MKSLRNKANDSLSIYGLHRMMPSGGRRILSYVYKCRNCSDWFHPATLSSKYCSAKCQRIMLSKFQPMKSEFWSKNTTGYIQGFATMGQGIRKFTKQHRWIMRNHLGRELGQKEHVHHINGNKSDNRINNLQVMSQLDHIALTRKEIDFKLSPKGRAKISAAWKEINRKKRAKRNEAKQALSEIKG